MEVTGPAFRFRNEIKDAVFPLLSRAKRGLYSWLLYRGVDQSGLERAREAGIDVRPTDHHWFGDAYLDKALEYGGDYPAVLVIDPAHAQKTWRELPVDAAQEEHAAARAFAPVEPWTSKDGTKIWYSRLPPDDRRRASDYETNYSYCIVGDPKEALLGYVQCVSV